MRPARTASKKTSCRGLSPPGSSPSASRSSWREKGSSRQVVPTLKTVWQAAMPMGVTARSRRGRSSSAPPAQNRSRKAAEPSTLKAMWTTATCRARRLTPMAESRAVTQVPMFWPRMMGMAAA